MKLLKELTTAEARAALDRIERGEHTQADINCLRAFCDRLDGAQYEARYWREQYRIVTVEDEKTLRSLPA